MDAEDTIALEKKIGGTESTTVDEAAGEEDPSFGGRLALEIGGTTALEEEPPDIGGEIPLEDASTGGGYVAVTSTDVKVREEPIVVGTCT